MITELRRQQGDADQEGDDEGLLDPDTFNVEGVCLEALIQGTLNLVHIPL